MIIYNINKNNLKNYLKEVGFVQSTPPFMLSIIALPLAIYFILVGYFFDKEALSLGYSALFINVFMFAIGVVNYLKLKKDIANIFKNEDIIHYKLELVQEKYLLDNVTTGQQITFKLDDIINVFHKKHTIIVRLKNKKIVFFPATEEIRKIMKIGDRGLS